MNDTTIVTPAQPDPSAPGGERVGAWRILRRLGEGGMGEVHLAERADGHFEQIAALKRVQGHLSEESRSRFLTERQLLSRLQHPNIATLLDGGVTADGRPYLVMDFVDGAPVTVWCEERRLPLRERLRLFRTICDTVGFAHANLVVHRDLKPQNILVTPEGRPVLLDFGIAKLLDPEEEGLTRVDERILTPEHAAPEQIRGGTITTAADVWALGVLLYELLAGSRPFAPAADRSRRVEEIVLEDDGEGIDEAALPTLFEIFQGSRDDHAGLGLASVRRILADQGAEISVASAIGKGTRVRLSWPLASGD